MKQLGIGMSRWRPATVEIGPFEPGMIVVVEPTMRLQGVGSFNIEDTTVVTEDGCDVLTSTPREWDAFL